jgi:tetratricopeptide (TPR) repeat protein
MAALWSLMVAQGWSANEVADNTRAANWARSAIALEPNDAVALATYGHIQDYLLRDSRTGRSFLDRALNVGPSCALAWGYSSLNRGYTGDYGTALSEAERALRLSPLGSDAFRFEHYLALAHYFAGQYDDAIAWGRVSHAHGPAFVSNVLCLICSHVARDDLDAAAPYTRKLLDLVPSFRLSGFRTRTPLIADIADRTIGWLRLAGVPD